MKRVIILCTGNSCRSQLAHAYLEKYGKGEIEVFSAGLAPAGVNPYTVRVLEEEGMVVSHYTSNHVNEYLHLDFDYIITVCDPAKDACPVFPGKGIRMHQSFPDPADARGTDEEIMAEFRRVREMVKHYCHTLAPLILAGIEA